MQAPTKICPYCQHPLADPDAVAYGLSPKQAAIFDIVKKAGQAGIEGPALVERLYANYTNPPETAQKSVHVTVHNLNKRIAFRGLKVASTSRGIGSRYTLRSTNQGAAPCQPSAPASPSKSTRPRYAV